MNLIGGPDWAVALFAAFLIAAAVQDGWRNTISNLLVIGLLVGGLASAALIGFDVSIWQNFAVLAAMLILGTFAFSTGLLGGGDVKLLAVTAFWFTPSDVLTFLLVTVLAGGVLVMIWMPIRMSMKGKSALATLKERSLPYGIAIALGGLLTAAIERGVFV